MTFSKPGKFFDESGHHTQRLMIKEPSIDDIDDQYEAFQTSSEKGQQDTNNYSSVRVPKKTIKTSRLNGDDGEMG